MIGPYLQLQRARAEADAQPWMSAVLMAVILVSWRWWFWGVLLVLAAASIVLVLDFAMPRPGARDEDEAPDEPDEDDDPVVYVVRAEGREAAFTRSMIRSLMQLPWDAMIATLDPLHATTAQHAAAAASGLLELQDDGPPRARDAGVIFRLAVRGLAAALGDDRLREVLLVVDEEPPMDLRVAASLVAMGLLTSEPTKSGRRFRAAPISKAVAFMVRRQEGTPWA